MKEDIKNLLLSTINPNENIRREAERQLALIAKREDCMLTVQQVLMNDNEQLVKQIASLFFANSIQNMWKAPEFLKMRENLIGNIEIFLKTQDKFPHQAYLKILMTILDKEEDDVIKNLFSRIGKYLETDNVEMAETVFQIYEYIFKTESLKFNLCDIMDIMFNEHGAGFQTHFLNFLSQRNYACAKMGLKILSRSYTQYTLPKWLNREDTLKSFLGVVVQVVNLPIVDDPAFQKMRKWAFFFLKKISYKGVRKYFKNNELSRFVTESANLRAITGIFNNVVTDFQAGVQMHPKILIFACDFFSLVYSNKSTKIAMKENCMFILVNFILPVHRFSGEIRDNFENDDEKYLNDRYNFLYEDLPSSTLSLFTELLHVDHETRDNIISMFVKYLSNPSDPEYSMNKYGIIRLLANNQKSIIRSLGAERFDEFLQTQIFADLFSKNMSSVSQALYFLSFTETRELSMDVCTPIFQQVMRLLMGENDIAAIEACLAMNFFLYHQGLNSQVRAVIPQLLEKTLQFSKMYFLESLNTFMDSIIECFTEEVSMYAPAYAETLCNSIMQHIQPADSNKISIISGYITTIDRLVMCSDNKPEIVSRMFDNVSKMVYFIFTNRCENFYQEAIDLVNSFLFIMEKVDERMMMIFKVALEVDREELGLYPREVRDFIDNFLSFGKTSMISTDNLVLICNAIESFIPDNEEDLYDEDFEAGCGIINSLMLNTGNAANTINAGLIPYLVRKITVNYAGISDNGNLDVYGLEALMNCFIVAPETVLEAMDGFIPTFFTELCTKFKKFKRVYDKKIFILFMGVLFRMTASLPLNIAKLIEGFVEILTTLPMAIARRNKMKDEEDEGEEEDNEDGADEYDGPEIDEDTLDEDIWFESELDKFDAYEYSRNLLVSPLPKSVGEQVIYNFNQEQIGRIKEVLEVEQVQQK